MIFKLSDIEEAFRFVSSVEPDVNHAVLNILTGEITYKAEMIDEEEFPEELEESEDHVWVPHRDDLDLGAGLIMDFAHQFLPGQVKAVKKLLKRKDAPARFEQLLVQTGTADAWRTFEREETREELKLWCEDNGIEYE